MARTHIVLHHTGAEEKDTAQVRRYHIQSLGWRDIGYNYVIERDGRIVTGRSLSIAGAHCRDGQMNTKGIGVALLGNMENHVPQSAQYSALINHLAALSRQHGIPISNILGHKEVPSATACPGRYVNMSQVRADVQQKLNPASVPANSFSVGQRVMVKPTATNYATGEKIANFVKGGIYPISQLKSDRALLDSSGICSWVKLTDIEPVSGNATAPVVRVGSRVKITGSRYATGQSIPQWVKNQTHTVSQVESDRVLLGYPSGICSWVLKKDIQVI